VFIKSYKNGNMDKHIFLCRYHYKDIFRTLSKILSIMVVMLLVVIYGVFLCKLLRSNANEIKCIVGMTSQKNNTVSPYPDSFDSLSELKCFAVQASEFIVGKFAPGEVQKWDIGGYRVYTCHRSYGASGSYEDLAIYTYCTTQGEKEKLRLFLSLPATLLIALEIKQAPNQILEIYNWNKTSRKRELFLTIHQVP